MVFKRRQSKKISNFAFLFGIATLLLLTAFTNSAQAEITIDQSIQGAKWTEITPSTIPPKRSSHHIVYDSTRDRVLMIGGASGPQLTDVWSYDFTSNDWTLVVTTGDPKGLDRSALVYDSANDKIIAFGGLDGGIQTDVMWELDLGTAVWSELTPTVKPEARIFSDAIYDPVNEKMILFGGEHLTNALSDMWEYDYSTNTWTDISTSAGPPGRAGHSMIYYPVQQSIVMMGGYNVDIFSEDDYKNPALGDTWEYVISTSTWTKLTDTDNNVARNEFSMVYHQAEDKIIAFGGSRGGTFAGSSDLTGGTWFLDFAQNDWKQFPFDDAPASRTNGNGMVYDTASEKIVLFGGYIDVTYQSDTWILEIVEQTSWPQDSAVIPPQGAIVSPTSNTSTSETSDEDDSSFMIKPVLMVFIIVTVLRFSKRIHR